MATNNSLNINASTPLVMAWGGTNSSLTATNGGIVYSDASSLQLLAGTATADQVLLSGSSAAPSFSTATYLPTLTANELVYASSSNTMAQLSTANSATLITSSSGVPSFTASFTNGQILIGSTGASPAPGTITAGAGISVTNGAASITIASISGVTWSSIAGTTQTAVANHGYYVSNASLTTITLPDTIAAGSVVRVAGTGVGGWTITPGSGQTINVGSVPGTASVASMNEFDCIELLCTVADTTWVTLSSQGSFDIN